MRSAPCCAMTGSATPSSLIRLCSVPMFCLMAKLLDALQRRRLQRGDQSELAAFTLVGKLQVWLTVVQRGTGLDAGFLIAETDDDAFAFAVDTPVTNRLVAHQAAQVGADRVQALGQSAFHVDLEQEVHPAAQVKTKIHRQGVQRWSATAVNWRAGSGRRRIAGRWRPD